MDKSQNFEASPLKRINLGLQVGVAYEYMGVNIGLDYNYMVSNMANKRFWEGERWKLFDYTGKNLMTGYKHRNNFLRLHIGYTFRY